MKSSTLPPVRDAQPKTISTSIALTRLRKNNGFLKIETILRPPTPIKMDLKDKKPQLLNTLPRIVKFNSAPAEIDSKPKRLSKQFHSENDLKSLDNSADVSEKIIIKISP